MPHFLRTLVFLAIAGLSAVSGSASALAASASGSLAWSTKPATLHEGPGQEYRILGQIPAEQRIKVLRCQKAWCFVDGPGGRGWTSLYAVDFGKSPGIEWNEWTFERPAPRQVCFYEGENYTGEALCAGPGTRIEDLLLLGADNRYSSVRVEGKVAAAACRDRDFQSYCERVVRSQPRLDQYLNNALSSIEVY
jgi:hypothetical protein